MWTTLAVAAILSTPVQCRAATSDVAVTPRSCGSFIPEVAARFGVSEARLSAIMRVESGGSARAVSRAGAMGCMQIMPGTWNEVRARYRLGGDAFDARDNVLAGAAYLRELIDRYGWPGALAAYNAGPNRYADFLVIGRPLPPETRTYVAQIAPVLNENRMRSSMDHAVELRPRWREAPIFVAANNAPGPPGAIPSNDGPDASVQPTDRTSAIDTSYPQPADERLFAVHRP